MLRQFIDRQTILDTTMLHFKDALEPLLAEAHIGAQETMEFLSVAALLGLLRAHQTDRGSASDRSGRARAISIQDA
jgi:hypothetical protein